MVILTLNIGDKQNVNALFDYVQINMVRGNGFANRVHRIRIIFTVLSFLLPFFPSFSQTQIEYI